jgi:hypothetical protein
MRKNDKLLATLCLVALISALNILRPKAQPEDWVASNGAYTGFIGMDGWYTIPEEAFGGSAPGAQINWFGAAAGPLEIYIDGGQGEGTWQLEGGGSIDGQFPAGAAPAIIEGIQTFGGEGELIGSFAGFTPIPISELLNAPESPYLTLQNFSPIQLFGEVWSEAEITITVGDNSNTASAGKVSEDVNVFLYYQAVSCTQIQGGWIEPAEQRLEESGIRPTLYGDWFVVRDDALTAENDDIFFQQMDEMIGDLQALRSRINACDENFTMDELDRVLRDTYSWLASLQTDVSCQIAEDPVEYLFPVTYAACTTIAAYWSNSCITPVSLPTDLGLVAYATMGMGCMGQDFFASEEEGLAAMEAQLLDLLAGLDLNNQDHFITATKILDAAYSLGMEDVVEATQEALDSYIDGGEGE